MTHRAQLRAPCHYGASTQPLPTASTGAQGPSCCSLGSQQLLGSHQAAAPLQPTPTQGCSQVPGAALQSPSIIFWALPHHLHRALSTLRYPAHEGRSLCDTSLVGAAAWAMAMTALGVGRTGQCPIPVQGQ